MTKANHGFRGYEMSYKVEIIEKKDPIVQLEASKSSIKDFFSDPLNETKGFKYQIKFKYQVLSFVKKKKCKVNEEIEFASVYFDSITKTMLSYRYSLKNAFQEVLYMIDAWNNEGSAWIVESIESQYINKGLINIKNKDQKCFLWCHISYINPSKEHLERI